MQKKLTANQILFKKLFDPDYCIRSCESKKSYESSYQAKFAADECMKKDKRLKLDWYLCELCRKWHLTERK